MHSFKALTFIAALAVSAVYGQDSSSASSSATSSSAGTVPTSISGIDPCILSCVTTAATANGCSSFADVSCVCSSTAFQTAAQDCLKANCTPEDLQTALGLQTAQCAAVSSSSGSGSASSSASESGSGSASATAPGSSSSGSASQASSNSSKPTSKPSTSSSSSASPTPTKKGNGASGLVVGKEFAVAFAGVVAGAVIF